jgi:signal peptide peptidase SppA
MKAPAWLARLPLPFLRGRPPVVPVLRLAGVIAGANLPLRGPMLNLAALAGSIDQAFEMRGAKAVALVVNSPGGSAVQSNLIMRRIRQLAGEKNLAVFAFVEDAAASGGYWLALAADEIYADANSIVGSIGVIAQGFGFDRLIERFGVERRIHTQGEKKSFLDPFAPEKADDVARLGRAMGLMHQGFKDVVRERRGAKLAGDEAGLFSGEFWTGAEALKLGLIDGLGDARSVLRARFGERVKLVPVGPARNWLRRRMGAEGPGWIDELWAAAEARALWARIGL